MSSRFEPRPSNDLSINKLNGLSTIVCFTQDTENRQPGSLKLYMYAICFKHAGT